MTTERYIPGVPNWLELQVADPGVAAPFYGDLFGWQFEDMMPGDPGGPYLMARQDGGDVAAICKPQPGVEAAATFGTYVLVDSAEASARAAGAAGGTVLAEPFDVPGVGRMATFADPAGAVVSAWEPGPFTGADVVNAHGSVNFNDLVVPDPGAVAPFYREAFGWELLDFGFMTMWGVAGYGEHLGKLQPGWLESFPEMGAPERFEDVVASVQAGDQAAWGVTFAVDDADAVAARAAELGAEVVSPPADMPWVRTTTLRDPHGLTFTASQFVPENR